MRDREPTPRDPVARARELSAELGEELWSLVAHEHGGLRDATPLTTRRSAPDRGACWRLEFLDGTVAKGRRVTNARKAERYERLGQLLAQPPFPAVTRRAGSALITDWIEGRTPAVLSEAHVHTAGDIHGALHTTQVPEELRVAASEHEGGGLERLAARLHALVRARVLEAAEGRRAGDLASIHRPAAPECGLIHGDFCAENFVVGADGTLWIVDNETLKVDCLDYDLAKTWYRWPMSPGLRREYLRGYERHRSPRTFMRHFYHYVIRATVSSAYHRMVRGSSGVEVAVAALRGQLAAAPAATQGDPGQPTR